MCPHTAIYTAEGGRDAFNDDVMVYTWDGDLMPSLSLQKVEKEPARILANRERKSERERDIV
jgi:hypothetical protein